MARNLIGLVRVSTDQQSESGLGREGSHHGIEEYVEIKYVMMAGV